MALNPQQFQQLPMFMTAREIMTQTKPGDAAGRDPAKMWASKLWHANAYGSSDDPEILGDSIRAKGVREPVTLHWSTQSPKPNLSDGHHRVAVANSISPDTFVPVKHIDLGRRWMA